MVLFHILRAVAGHCSGTACDWFIPLSLLLPLLVVLLVAVTGIRTSVKAWKEPGHQGWAIALAVLTVLGVAGPILALAVFRDSPDRFVLIATAMVAPLPVAAVIYTSTGARSA